MGEVCLTRTRNAGPLSLYVTTPALDPEAVPERLTIDRKTCPTSGPVHGSRASIPYACEEEQP